MPEITTHGVIRVAPVTATIDGKSGGVAYVMPPRLVDIRNATEITSTAPLEECDLAELRTIASWLDVSSRSRTAKGLQKAILKHVESQLTNV